MAISNDLLSSTLYSIRDGEVDELFQKVAFLDNAKKLGGVDYEDGGYKLQRPLALAEHSSITQLATGYEPVNLAVNDIMRPAIYEWADFTAPIVVTRKEELENSGEKAIVKIVEARMRSVMSMLRRELNKQLIAGNSSVLSSVNTLNGGSTTSMNDGFFEKLAVGSQVNSVGGLDKTLYQGTPGFQNQVIDIGTGAGAFSTDGIRKFQEMAIRCGSVAPMGEVNLVLLSEAAMANYRRALFNQERYINEKTLDAGRMALAFGGAMVEQDLELGFDYGGDIVSGYFLNFDAIKLIFHKDADFAVSAFENVTGTTARAAQLYVKLQMVADHLGSNGIIMNAETW